MKIIAIIGSPRPKGNTTYLTDTALEEAAKLGAETVKYNLSEMDIRPCQGHELCATYDSCRRKDDAPALLDRMCEADGVILVTPVYYYNVSAQMKTFIDRNYFSYKHHRRSGARAVGVIVVSGSEGNEDTLHTLGQFINESFSVSPERLFIVSGHASKPGAVVHNLPLVEEARQLGRKMAEALAAR